MSNNIIETNELIAVRKPPGDNWELLIEPGEVIAGLVQTLTQYMRKTKFKGHYRLEPLDGKLFCITHRPAEEPEQEVYDLYGEGEY